MEYSVVVGDITELEVDAIVNAANSGLQRGAGVCGAIFRAAGPQLQPACDALAPCPTGEARITPGFDAKARAIVHAVGPIWRGGGAGEAELLASAYRNALQLAHDAALASIAFPCISTGIYGYPREDAARVAIETIRAWSAPSPARAIFCCFSPQDAAIYERL